MGNTWRVARDIILLIATFTTSELVLFLCNITPTFPLMLHKLIYNHTPFSPIYYSGRSQEYFIFFFFYYFIVINIILVVMTILSGSVIECPAWCDEANSGRVGFRVTLRQHHLESSGQFQKTKNHKIPYKSTWHFYQSWIDWNRFLFDLF